MSGKKPAKDPVIVFIDPMPSVNPEVPPDTEIILAPTSLIIGGVLDSCHFLPKTLDIPTLRRSIQVLSSIVPTICSRFRMTQPDEENPHGRFWFEYTKSPIPFDTQYCEDESGSVPSVVDQPMPVSSSKLEHLLPPLNRHTANDPNSGHPPCAFRLTTYPSGKCCLAFQYVHVLGDAFTHRYFVYLLSEIYTSLIRGEEYHPTQFPTFESGHRDILRNAAPLPPWDHIPYAFSFPAIRNALKLSDLPAHMAANGFRQPFKEVEVLFTRRDIDTLKKQCMAVLERQGQGPTYLSTVDVLAGWYVSMSQRGIGEEVHQISYIFNLRAVGLHPPNYLGSAVLPIEIDVSPSTHPSSTPIEYIASVARSIRQTVDRVRNDAQFRDQFFPLHPQLLVKTVLEGKEMNYFCEKGRMMLNSYTGFDFAVDFGFPPEQCQIQMGSLLFRIPRINIANRIPGQVEAERMVELAFKVPEAREKDVLEVLREDRQGWERVTSGA